MQLQQVERIDSEISQAIVNPAREVLAAVALDGLPGQLPSRLGGNDDLFLAFLLQPRDQPLAASVAIDVGRVDEVDAGIHGRMQRPQGFIVGNLAPGAADRPRSKTDFGDIPSCAA